MTALDIKYRNALLPHVTDLRTPHGIDLNLAEEVLARHRLTDLDRAERVLANMRPGSR